MKGVFANIGADAISKQAYHLEYASKNGDSLKCKQETEGFLRRMTEFKEKLLTTSLMPVEEAGEKRQVEATELMKTLDTLKDACKQGLSDEADSLAESLKGMSFSETADPLIRELRELIASLDYDEAIEKVETLLTLCK
jgi:hypothetical protein